MLNSRRFSSASMRSDRWPFWSGDRYRARDPALRMLVHFVNRFLPDGRYRIAVLPRMVRAIHGGGRWYCSEDRRRGCTPRESSFSLQSSWALAGRMSRWSSKPLLFQDVVGEWRAIAPDERRGACRPAGRRCLPSRCDRTRLKHDAPPELKRKAGRTVARNSRPTLINLLSVWRQKRGSHR